MTTQVIRSGSSIRIVVEARGIASTTIDANSHLIITYDDGTTEDAGYVGGGGTPSPTLATLTLSGSLQIGTAASGTINGATVGSTIAGNIPGVAVNSGARTYSGTPTGTAQTITNGLVETLAGAVGSPKSSAIVVQAAASSAPSITTAPTFTGTTGEGQMLTGTRGTYTNSPTSYTNQWQRSSDSGATWTAISGATSLNYTLVTADVGNVVRLTEIAINSFGSSAQNNSTASGTVSPATANTLYGEGDSIVAGGASHFGVLSGVYPVTTFTNAAVGGSTQTGGAPSLTDRQPAMLAADPRVLYSMIGPNDLTNTTKYPNVNDWIADRQAYLTAAKGGGAKNVVGTILPRQNFGGFTDAALHNSRRAAVRTWYISQLGGLVDAIADYDATVMGPDTAPNNATYYDGDKLHPTSAGQDAMKANCKAAVNAAFGIANSVTSFSFTDASGATAGATVESDDILIGGLAYGETRTATPTGGAMRITPMGGTIGAATTTPTAVKAGDRARLAGSANTTPNGTTNVTLNVGGVSDTFTITTANNLSPLTTTYRSGASQTRGFDTTADFTGVQWYTGRAIIIIEQEQGSVPAALVMKNGATTIGTGTLMDSLANGSSKISAWTVPLTTSGTGGTISVSGVTGGLQGIAYQMWSTDSNAAFVESKKLINYASGDPGEAPSISLPAGGSILAGAYVPSGGNLTPTAGNTERFDVTENSNRYWGGDRATTGQVGLNGIAFTGGNILVVSIQPS